MLTESGFKVARPADRRLLRADNCARGGLVILRNGVSWTVKVLEEKDMIGEEEDEENVRRRARTKVGETLFEARRMEKRGIG